MAEIVRCNLYFPSSTVESVDRMAERRGVSRTTMVRIALGVLQAADDGAANGQTLVLTRRQLSDDVVLVAPL